MGRLVIVVDRTFSSSVVVANGCLSTGGVNTSFKYILLVVYPSSSSSVAIRASWKKFWSDKDFLNSVQGFIKHAPKCSSVISYKIRFGFWVLDFQIFKLKTFKIWILKLIKNSYKILFFDSLPEGLSALGAKLVFVALGLTTTAFVISTIVVAVEKADLQDDLDACRNELLISTTTTTTTVATTSSSSTASVTTPPITATPEVTETTPAPEVCILQLPL